MARLREEVMLEKDRLNHTYDGRKHFKSTEGRGKGWIQVKRHRNKMTSKQLFIRKLSRMV